MNKKYLSKFEKTNRISFILVLCLILCLSGCKATQTTQLGDSNYQIELPKQCDIYEATMQDDWNAKYYMIKENAYLEIYQWQCGDDYDLESEATNRILPRYTEEQLSQADFNLTVLDDEINQISAMRYWYEEEYDGEVCEIICYLFCDGKYFVETRYIIPPDSDFDTVVTYINSVTEIQ